MGKGWQRTHNSVKNDNFQLIMNVIAKKNLSLQRQIMNLCHIQKSL